MITQNRWQHILGVARKANLLAKKLYPDNVNFSEDMFILGLLHDVGYEFSEVNSEHAILGGEILKRNGYQYYQELAMHGNCNITDMDDALFILNCADMTTSSDGINCTMEERLNDIAERYGFDSQIYKEAVILTNKLKNDARYTIIETIAK